MIKSFLFTSAVIVHALALAGAARAQQGNHHAGAARGDESRASRYHFEATFSTSGVKLVVHGLDMKPLDSSGLKATATFYHPNSPKAWLIRELRTGKSPQGLAPRSLELAINLAKVPAKGARATFQVTGLPDPAEPSATFTVPFAFADDGNISVGAATRADEQAIATAKVCPISGDSLGEMGDPVKATRGGKSVFLCCKGCLKKLQDTPDKYIGEHTH